MQQHHIPGSRIGGYRNSEPRKVRLYGLGTTGTTVVGKIGSEGRPNVAVRTGSAPVNWKQVVGNIPDPDTNMIVVVCGEGDEKLFDVDADKPNTLVTFVLLQNEGSMLVVGDSDVTNARARCDLFVTTSDVDYVVDLIENLAS